MFSLIPQSSWAQEMWRPRTAVLVVGERYYFILKVLVGKISNDLVSTDKNSMRILPITFLTEVRTSSKVNMS